MTKPLSPHNCGQCGQGFTDENAYLNHKCKTGFTPADPENLGQGFQAVQAAALKRGAEREAPAKPKKKAKT